MNKDWKIAILTSESSWFIPYASQLKQELSNNYTVELFHNHSVIDSSYEIVFILSYFNIIEDKFLDKHEHNLVVHESDLPEGKGWAPLFWQILEGKNTIPVTLFEASEEVDSGQIYLKDQVELEGHELNNAIRKKQAQKTLDLCNKFIRDYNDIAPTEQRGKETFYPRRTPEDSELDVNKTIKEQFNLLRIVNNKEFPAFFKMEGKKYILKIYKEEDLDDE